MSPAELSRIIFSLCINIFKCVKHTVHSKLRWLEVIFKVLDVFKKKLAAQPKVQDVTHAKFKEQRDTFGVKRVTRGRVVAKMAIYLRMSYMKSS